MDQYAVFIWASYAVAATVLIGMAWISLASARATDRLVDMLQATSGRRNRRRRAAERDGSGEPAGSASVAGSLTGDTGAGGVGGHGS